MSQLRLPYLGYETPPEDWEDVTKVAELIHRRRRQVAMAAFLYYSLNEIIITDHEYEFRVLSLIELQTRFPKIASSVPFMKKFFMEEDISATGFHLASYIEKSQSKDCQSMRSRSIHTLNHLQNNDLLPYQSAEIGKKLLKVKNRLSTL